MSCCLCVLVRDFDGCEVFPVRNGIDLSSVCNYFEKKNCKQCKKFRNGGCILGIDSPKKCEEFSKK